ncbi:hypothetical protein M8J75_006901 [Diaphorina citri]|nr:hypothetical protein M8J75_006901 [Diaphorina citri]
MLTVMKVALTSLPPNIDDSLSSSDVIVREGANVTLSCHATGSPPPVIKWKRDDIAKININKTHAGEWYGGRGFEARKKREKKGSSDHGL